MSNTALQDLNDDLSKQAALEFRLEKPRTRHEVRLGTSGKAQSVQQLLADIKYVKGTRHFLIVPANANPSHLALESLNGRLRAFFLDTETFNSCEGVGSLSLVQVQGTRRLELDVFLPLEFFASARNMDALGITLSGIERRPPNEDDHSIIWNDALKCELKVLRAAFEVSSST